MDENNNNYNVVYESEDNEEEVEPVVEVNTKKENVMSQITQINNKLNFLMNQVNTKENKVVSENNIHDVILFIIFGIFVLIILECLYKLISKILIYKNGLNINLS